MIIYKPKPTSPGRRNVIKILNKNLYKGRPLSILLKKKKKKSGRNNMGRITTRHKGGQHKRYYRIIDFKRNEYGIKGYVKRIEYDPNRNCNIALIYYLNGKKKYILHPKNLNINDEIISNYKTPIKIGNNLLIKNIPLGTLIHCLELLPFKGAQIARSAGSSALIISREKKYTQVRLKSNEIRRINNNCFATIGEIGNEKHNLIKLGKAGIKRNLGIRPTVRGVAMNPIDHPHGGGEGRTSGGRHPVTPWGKKTKGKKTRNKKKISNNMIINNKNDKIF
ncbi:50S ribosomal subunit protein L2 [Candidatus Zinderia insecticola CARI]|uniref:Large ribosomal subunit protein uL2 n=1 Tax=Zinderia insecticola (strain CARI) TaxID=871271 RepID=E0TJ44_ZINIC|nr:50S ribosomal subunit protein L2 [Candidatus Zinderia insecticola CARI]